MKDYELIDIQSFPRKEYYLHYEKNATTFSITKKIDITKLIKWNKSKGIKFYPSIIYLIMKVINEYDYFKYDKIDGNLVLWNTLIPEFTIFSDKLKTFSSIQVNQTSNFDSFFKNFEIEVEKYKHSGKLFPQNIRQGNSFYISCLPWISFSDFNLDFKGDSLKPIITIGKYEYADDQYFLPMNVKFHHAVNDGYHASLFFKSLDEYIESL
ncbi:chloramphenicol O-acetyltransferase [Streptococcus porcinus]|uniref:Chloramphenicol O-acetyltransferase n=1 Tax=Streptococcus porcinus TaxID=1340 RepID=A0A4V0GXU2_STRPO|nr:CatA-like O-acetyltransferase [Streptococcus porcinus]VTT41450.1 chloramphenicol O-acetyltransferase [Streptococcus porcinus]